MISLTTATSPLLRSNSLSLNPSLIQSLKPLNKHQLRRLRRSLNQRRFGIGRCRAELANDAPIAVAIGACILNSLVFPIAPSPDDEETDSVIDSADARFAVMGIISFIPYFNWMSWIFAWLDTGKRRYAVYAIVYLAPYLRTNLSLSPEESWLPIASILLCILHIQLEASIKDGDIQGLRFFSEARKHLSTFTRKTDSTIYEEEITPDHKNLPSAQWRDNKLKWRVPEKPSKDPEHSDKDGEDHTGRKH
nr:Replication factor C large subunit like [Ipomoea batatas]GMD97533.1 Replication factor C large subunit like [Ipomoea batatas]